MVVTQKSSKKISAPFTRSLHETSLTQWFESELDAVDKIEADLLRILIANVESFVKFPIEGRLYFDGMVRKRPMEAKYVFPQGIQFSKQNPRGKMETMTNGPAVVAYELAGGDIPMKRNGKSWSIHHLYSNDFAYYGRNKTTHAVKEPKHFTHSAGLVAIHPMADAAAHEYPCFTWFLRAKAYLLFGYDPDIVFEIV